MNITEAIQRCNNNLKNKEIYLGINGRVFEFSGKDVTLRHITATSSGSSNNDLTLEVSINTSQTFQLDLRQLSGQISEDGKDMELFGRLNVEGNYSFNLHIKDWTLHTQGLVYDEYIEIE